MSEPTPETVQQRYARHVELAREIAENSHLTAEQIVGSLVPPPVELPAPTCPPWCAADHSEPWSWTSTIDFVEPHEVKIASVAALTVLVVADETVTAGQPPVLGAPRVELVGDADGALADLDALNLGCALISAVARLSEIAQASRIDNTEEDR